MDMNTFFNDMDQDTFDRDSLLAALSLDVIKENIELQIDGSFESSLNFLGIVTDKFNEILQYDRIDEEDKREIKEQVIDFCDDLTSTISNKFDLGINMIFDDYENRLNLLFVLYDFFVLEEYDNVISFLKKYISANKNDLVESLNLPDEDGSDITTIANKKLGMDTAQVAILSHMDDIIEFIRRGDFITAEEFLSMIKESDSAEKMLSYYEESVIIGNFVPVLLNEILGSDYQQGSVSKVRGDLRVYFATGQE